MMGDSLESDMQKIYESGDKSSAICHNCEKVVKTTFKYADIPCGLVDPVAIKHVLVARCDECEEIVAIPAQSVPEITRQIKR